MTEKAIGRGTLLAGRFRLEDLVHDTDGARFWRAVDQVLARNVAVHVVDDEDPRSEALLSAARTSATITEAHFLRVLDAAHEDGVVYVVHEWGTGMSLDKMLADGPLAPRRAAWLVKEVAEAIAFAHGHGIAHGRLVPENVMVTEAGSVKLIGFVVDAVLHGRRQPATPDGRTLSDHESDVHNLAALLYTTLVGKWPGSLDSQVPDAPRDHDRVLRPRQVRAGVPRPLDTICDQVLNPHDNVGSLETAHEICAALSDYIGEVLAPPATEATTVLDREELEREALRQEQADRSMSRHDDPDATQAAPGPLPLEDDVAGPSGASDPESTQASAPWFAPEEPRRTPPPPPPFEDPEPRPLFAPGPRRSSPGAGSADDTAAPVRGLHAAHGTHRTGGLPPQWGPDDPEEPGPRWSGSDSSRDWLKLAAAVGVIALLVLAIVFAFNLGRDAGTDPAAEGQPTPSRSAAPPQRLPVASATDLDPPPDGNGEENAELAGLAVDGDPSTSWQTMEYYNNPQFGLLKDGVGLVLDLGRQREVSRVEVTVTGSPTAYELYAAPDAASAPSSVQGLSRVAEVTGAGGRTVTRLDDPVRTRYLVLWLTSLPPSDGAFRGQVSEIVVKG